MSRQIRRLLLICALIGGVAFMHHVGAPHTTTAPDRPAAAALTVANTGGHEATSATHGHAGGLVETDGIAAGHTDDEASAGAHDLLHLCMAVVVSALLVLLGWSLIWTGVLWWFNRPSADLCRSRPLMRPREPCRGVSC